MDPALITGMAAVLGSLAGASASIATTWRWLASRIEIRTRRLRRALRDHQRAEVRRIRDADRRALGLRLYAAWSCKEKRAMSYGTVLAWQSPPEEIAA